MACFLDGPAERLLHVDMLAQIHRRRCDRRVHVVGRRDDDAVDVLLLVEHLAVVLVPLQLRHLLVDELPRVLGHVGRGPARVRLELRLRRIGAALLARAAGAGRACRSLGAGERAVEQRVIHVADGDDVLAHEVARVGEALAVDADRGDVQRIAWGLEAAAENVARHDRERSARRRDRRHKLPPADTGRVFFLLFAHDLPLGALLTHGHSHVRAALVKRGSCLARGQVGPWRFINPCASHNVWGARRVLEATSCAVPQAESRCHSCRRRPVPVFLTRGAERGRSRHRAAPGG